MKIRINAERVRGELSHVAFFIVDARRQSGRVSWLRFISYDRVSIRVLGGSMSAVDLG